VRRSSDERGTLTIWMLGLCVMLLFLGGISLDLWRAYDERHTLAGEADAAAVAGAGGIDQNYFSTYGEVRLDPAAARSAAESFVQSQPDAKDITDIQVTATTDRVTVKLTRNVDFTLMKILGNGHITVSVTSSAGVARSP
jgi:Flp pilus assembly protein TadG